MTFSTLTLTLLSRRLTFGGDFGSNRGEKGAQSVSGPGQLG